MSAPQITTSRSFFNVAISHVHCVEHGDRRGLFVSPKPARLPKKYIDACQPHKNPTYRQQVKLNNSQIFIKHLEFFPVVLPGCFGYGAECWHKYGLFFAGGFLEFYLWCSFYYPAIFVFVNDVRKIKIQKNHSFTSHVYYFLHNFFLSRFY